MPDFDAIYGKKPVKPTRKRKKATTRNLPEDQKINQVIERLELFVKILGNTQEKDDRIWGQITAFGAALTLLRQVKKRGELWKGGYLDNVGVVYTDQVADFLKAQEEAKSAEA